MDSAVLMLIGDLDIGTKEKAYHLTFKSSGKYFLQTDRIGKNYVPQKLFYENMTREGKMRK